MEKLLEILDGIRPDVDFNNENKLIDDGILDSFDMVSIISDLMDEYQIEIKVHELGPENFNSVEAMMNMIVRLKKNNDISL